MKKRGSFGCSFFRINQWFVTSVGEWTQDIQDIEVKKHVFTVDDEGSQVIFAPGNLYWDGTKYCFEEHQYDFVESNTDNHIGYFTFSRDETIARSSVENDPAAKPYDFLFAAFGKAIEGWTVLTDEQWSYISSNKIGRHMSLINGKYCTILTPDGFTGEVKDSYTASEWSAAERKGLVALPCTQGEYGFYWAMNAYGDNTGDAMGIAVGVPNGSVSMDNRFNSYSTIRLVKFVNHVKKDGIYTLKGGRKCKFAPGDLYWDGVRYRFENSQLDKPSTNTATHVGLFYWNKDASIARDISLSYDNPILKNVTDGDVLFAADGGAISGWTVLSGDELSGITNGDHYIEGAVINGKKYDLLIPDDFNLGIYYNFNGYDRNEGYGTPLFYGGEISSSEWEFLEAEYGLVALAYRGASDYAHWCKDLEYPVTPESLFAYCIPHTDGGYMGISVICVEIQLPIRLAKYID